MTASDSSIARTSPRAATQPIALWGLGIYGQDEWRVNKSLKLTLAIRFEHNSNPVCQTNCGAIGPASFTTLINSGALGCRWHDAVQLDHR